MWGSSNVAMRDCLHVGCGGVGIPCDRTLYTGARRTEARGTRRTDINPSARLVSNRCLHIWSEGRQGNIRPVVPSLPMPRRTKHVE